MKTVFSYREGKIYEFEVTKETAKQIKYLDMSYGVKGWERTIRKVELDSNSGDSLNFIATSKDKLVATLNATIENRIKKLQTKIDELIIKQNQINQL